MDEPACLRIVVDPPLNIFTHHLIKIKPGDHYHTDELFQPSSKREEVLVFQMLHAAMHPWEAEDTERIEIKRTLTRAQALVKCEPLLTKMRMRSDAIWVPEFAAMVFDAFDTYSVQVLDREDYKTINKWAAIYEDKAPPSNRTKVANLIESLVPCQGQSDTISWKEEAERPLGNKSPLTYNTKRLHLIANQLQNKGSCRPEDRKRIFALRQCANAEQVFLRDMEDDNAAKFRMLCEAQKRVKHTWEAYSKIMAADNKACSEAFVEEMSVMWNVIFGPGVDFPEIGPWEDSLPYRRCSQ